MDYLGISLSKLKEFEGCVPWMYLDTLGNVTVWVGFMLPTPERACQLSFHLPADPQPASQAATAAEWKRVKAMPAGRLPGFYRATTSLELLDPDGDELLRSRWMQDEAQLRADFEGYDGYPDEAKLALHDLLFNVGAGSLRLHFPHLRAAVMGADFHAAAAYCHRRGVAEARNRWTAEQFKLAELICLERQKKLGLQAQGSATEGKGKSRFPSGMTTKEGSSTAVSDI